MSSTLDTKQTHTQLTLLPAELWQDIVGLENLRVRDVASYRLVCKLFGSLGQGCMFRNLIFRFNLGIFIREGTAGIAKNIFQKLEFYSSESIAHHVRYCEFEGFSFTSPPHEMDSVIIHRFFETLPRFQNVSHLAIHYAELNRFELEQLARLPTLERLDITDCIIREPTLPELGLNLRHLQLCADTLYNTNDSILRWLLLGQHFTRITQLRIVLRTMKGIDLVETVSPLVRRLDTVRVTILIRIVTRYLPITVEQIFIQRPQIDHLIPRHINHPLVPVALPSAELLRSFPNLQLIRIDFDIFRAECLRGDVPAEA